MGRFYQLLYGGSGVTGNPQGFRVDEGESAAPVLTFSDTIPTNIKGIDYSPDQQYVAVALAGSPYLALYRRVGNSFERLPDPAEMPSTAVNGASFSFDGRFLALALNAAPYIMVYEISGETFTLVTDHPAPPNRLNCIAFSTTGNYLAMGSYVGNRFFMWSYSGSTFTEMSWPDIVPDQVYSVCWSKDGSKVAFTAERKPFVYRLDGGAFLREDVDFDAQNSCRAICFDADAGRFYVGFITSSPYVQGYTWDEPTSQWLRQDAPPSAGSNTWALRVTPDGAELWAAVQNSPYLRRYDISGGTPVLLPDPAPVTSASKFALAITPWLYEGQTYAFADTLFDLLNGTVNLGSLRVALLSDSALFNGAHTTLAEVTGNGSYEVSGNNWPAGGVPIPGVAFEKRAPVGAVLKMGVASGNIVGGDLTAYRAVVYDDDHVDDKPLLFVDFNSEVTALNGEQFVLTFAETGVLVLQKG